MKAPAIPVSHATLGWILAAVVLLAAAWLRKPTSAPPPPATATSSPSAAHLRVSAACEPGKACKNCMDCSCDEDEVAIGGGGNCGPSSALTESANPYVTSSTDRNEHAWRVACSAHEPINYYALCMKR